MAHHARGAVRGARRVRPQALLGLAAGLWFCSGNSGLELYSSCGVILTASEAVTGTAIDSPSTAPSRRARRCPCASERPSVCTRSWRRFEDFTCARSKMPMASNHALSHTPRQKVISYRRGPGGQLDRATWRSAFTGAEP